MGRSTGTAAAAARAALEGWRPAVKAAQQPVLLLDAGLGVVAASAAARQLLGLDRDCRQLADCDELAPLAKDGPGWDLLPFVRAVSAGGPQRAVVALPRGADVDVLASPLFGPAGVIGATVFLTVL